MLRRWREKRLDVWLQSLEKTKAMEIHKKRDEKLCEMPIIIRFAWKKL